MKTLLTGLKLSRLFLFLLFLLLTTYSCRKDSFNYNYDNENKPANLFDGAFANLKDKDRIAPDEISAWVARTLPADLREQVHFNTAQQNVVNGKHLIRINISPDSYLFFTKENGQLKVWIYRWMNDSGTQKNFTGQLLSYSFQNSKLYGLIYKNNAVTRWGYLETGLPKLIQGTKQTQSIFGVGFFKALWCVLTGRDWNDQTKIDGRCVENSGAGGVIETVINFIANLFDDSGGSGDIESSNGFFLFNGAPPTSQQPNNGTSVGDSNTSQNYLDGYLWLSQWVPAQPDAGCPVTSPNGDQQPIGTIDDSPTGPNCNPQGHWESVLINENSVIDKLITRLGITDANKQNYLYNNADVAGELYLYLLESNNTQDDIDFVNWAVGYLMENPNQVFNDILDPARNISNFHLDSFIDVNSIDFSLSNIAAISPNTNPSMNDNLGYEFNINTEPNFVDIIIDSSFTNNSQLNSIYNILNNQHIIQKILNNFFGKKAPINLEFKAINTGVDFLGYTRPIGSPGNPYTNRIIIEIDPIKAASRPNLMVAKTIIHEIIHAEMWRILKLGEKGVASNNYNKILNYYLAYLKKFKTSNKFVSEWDHNYMANHYISTISQAMMDFDNNPNIPICFYKMLAWEGLHYTPFFSKLSSTNQTYILNAIVDYINTQTITPCINY